MPMRVAVCVSGGGSNLRALLEAFPPGSEAEVVLVVSNRADAPALDRARARGIPAVTLDDPANGAEWLRRLEVGDRADRRCRPRHGDDVPIAARGVRAGRERQQAQAHHRTLKMSHCSPDVSRDDYR